MDSTIFPMIRRCTLAALSLFLLTGMIVRDLHPAAAASDPVRVWYLFNPASAEQVERLHDLQSRTVALGNVDLTGLSRTETVPDGIHVVWVDRFLQDSTIDPTTRQWVSERLNKPGDALRVEGPFAVHTSDGNTVEGTAQLAGMTLHTTDIDFSTWGKVKDLFR